MIKTPCELPRTRSPQEALRRGTSCCCYFEFYTNSSLPGQGSGRYGGAPDARGLATCSRRWGPGAPSPHCLLGSPPHRFTGRSVSSNLRMDFPSISEGMSRPAMSRMVGARSMLRTMWGFLGEAGRADLALSGGAQPPSLGGAEAGGMEGSRALNAPSVAQFSGTRPSPIPYLGARTHPTGLPVVVSSARNALPAPHYLNKGHPPLRATQTPNLPLDPSLTL